MKKQCNCELPYVLSNTDNCTICNGYNGRFLFNTNPLSIKQIFNGNEFKVGDVVEIKKENYACLVKINKYIKDGWYRVKLPNGGFHETQILGKRVS